MSLSNSSPAIQHPSFFVLRSPLLPISELSTELTQTANSSQLTLLKRLLNRPYVLEALYLASPTLLTEIESWLHTPTSELSATLELALWKYLLRMSSRCTPFGLFAGYAIGQVTNETQIELAPNEFRAKIQLDRAIKAQIIQYNSADINTRSRLIYILNNSLYQVGQQYRYSEHTGIGNERTVQLACINDSTGLQTVINAFRNESSSNGVSFEELVKCIQNLGYLRGEATDFVNELIDAQLLISELAPKATGPVSDGRIFGLSEDTKRRVALDELNKWLTANDSSLCHLKKIEEGIRGLSIDTSSVKSVVQVDTRWHVHECTLTQSVIGQVGCQLTQLMSLRNDSTSNPLRAFIIRFYDRFGEQTVPLLTALDPDLGVGYGHAPDSSQLSLLKGLAISNSQTDSLIPADRLSEWRLRKFTEVLRSETNVLKITSEDLIELSHSTLKTPLAYSWYAHGTLLSNNTKAIDEGTFQFLLRSAAGPSALNLLGRFASGDEQLADQLCQLAAWEQQQYSDTVLAEIIHLPTDRMGNVINRPSLRPYEIPYLTDSSVDAAHTITLNELTISAPRGQEIVLYSKRLGKRIIPRLSTAHNFHLGDDVYRFLCDMQYHDRMTQLNWSWGLLHNQPILPRVVFQQVILARAQWTLSQTQLPPNLSPAQTIAWLRNELQLPDWVALVDGDNELVLNLTVCLCQKLLFNELKKRKTIKLVEWLATPDQCWVRQGEQRFTSEIIIPFGYQDKTNLSSPPIMIPSDIAVKRSFPPGSEWLYIKIYVRGGTADEFLDTLVGPLTIKLLTEQLIDNWFFVRYADPDPHLRLRFHCTNHTHIQVLDQFNAILAASCLSSFVQRIQLDTYERELERYGFSTILYCEMLFGIDSELVIGWLMDNRETLEEESRWLFACERVDTLLTDFGISLSEKVVLLGQLQEAYFIEHGGSKELKKQLNNRYRQWSGRIDSTVNGQPFTQSNDKSILIASLIKKQFSDESDNKPLLNSLISSLIHMTLNRIFSDQQRRAELVVYHFMARHYKSVQARQAKAENLAKVSNLHFTE